MGERDDGALTVSLNRFVSSPLGYNGKKVLENVEYFEPVINPFGSYRAITVRTRTKPEVWLLVDTMYALNLFMLY